MWLVLHNRKRLRTTHAYFAPSALPGIHEPLPGTLIPVEHSSALVNPEPLSSRSARRCRAGRASRAKVRSQKSEVRNRNEQNTAWIVWSSAFRRFHVGVPPSDGPIMEGRLKAELQTSSHDACISLNSDGWVYEFKS
jgi:hypothetical protein